MDENRVFTVPVRGDKIRKLRKERRWTQEDLAEKSGVSIRKIQALEAGKPALPRATIQPIADAFGITRDQLIRGKEVDQPRPNHALYEILGIKIGGKEDDPDDRDVAHIVEQISTRNPKLVYIVILGTRPSTSYYIFVEVRRGDAKYIISAFTKGMYADLGVIEVIRHHPEINRSRQFPSRYSKKEKHPNTVATTFAFTIGPSIDDKGTQNKINKIIDLIKKVGAIDFIEIKRKSN